MDSTEDRPGHHGGGRLKAGNPKHVGRPRSEVRAVYLQGAERGGEWMARVAAGEKCVRADSDRGGRAGLRHPTYDEQVRAAEICAKYGLGVQREVMGKDGGPIDVNPNARPDLSGLTLEEKEQMLALAEKAEANRQEPPE